MNPSKDIAPSELWAALTQIPRPFRIVPFPRKDPNGTPVGELAIWVLTQEEQIAAAADAERTAKKLLSEASDQTTGMGYADVYRNEATVQVLYRACRDAKDPKKPVFPSPGEMRKKLTVDEIGTLVRHYYTAQAELGPIVTDFESEGEQEAWIRRLAEGGSAFPIDSLSPELVDRLLISMASQLVSFWTAMSSAGSQQNAPPETHPADGMPEPAPLE